MRVRILADRQVFKYLQQNTKTCFKQIIQCDFQIFLCLYLTEKIKLSESSKWENFQNPRMFKYLFASWSVYCICVSVCVCTYKHILTVRYTLILDLQVLVCSGAGIWEDVDPGDHHTLSPVVASVAVEGGRGGHRERP